MPTKEPRYTADNCKCSYQLNWTLTLFWKEPAIPEDDWIAQLSEAVEKDGVRILEYREKEPLTSQFLLSTKSSVTPSKIVWSLKGRLQHEIRKQCPRAFKGNFSIKSVGDIKSADLEAYLDSQLTRHATADAQALALLEQYQIDNASDDLDAPRMSSHGEIMHNLHLVLVNDGRFSSVSDEGHASKHSIITRTAEKKGHLLAKARILADHIHLMVGCGITESPEEVALAYMNNIAYAHEMRPVLQFGFFAGTFSTYDIGAIRNAL